MSFSAESIPYGQTNSFSRIISDYLEQSPALREFYTYSPDIAGIKKAVADRPAFPINRDLLYSNLQQQYVGQIISGKLKANIDALREENCFTVCTAHQPNIFTGHLYFIYKILHAIRLSAELNEAMPANKFVPVFYMGTEDADLEELGEVTINAKQYNWKTNQTGAVGRMTIDKAFIQLIDEIESRLTVESYGPAVMQAVRKAYAENRTVEKATFDFVHELFNEFGLVILLPDQQEFKNSFADVIRKELRERFSHEAVNQTVAAFPPAYKVQAAGRSINLFYLEGNSRERIGQNGDGFMVANTTLHFTAAELERTLQNSPEKFSPNVILRPVFQEMILPNIAFIGGGGELAYWLELKKVFEEAGAFFPVLLLRNSFAILNKHTGATIKNLGLTKADLFQQENRLLDELVKKTSDVQLSLEEEISQLKAVYESIKAVASAADRTLCGHVHALSIQAMNRLEKLEKKMLKAEKKKFESQQRQIRKIKNMVSPGGVLQERVDNILEYLAVYGPGFLQMLYNNSSSIPEGFTILTEE
ncbi:MAG: bacillithiol biosynthesis cysteine-adding enzyme BshC [Ferruginibacter sp.]